MSFSPEEKTKLMVTLAKIERSLELHDKHVLPQVKENTKFRFMGLGVLALLAFIGGGRLIESRLRQNNNTPHIIEDNKTGNK